MKQHLQDAIAEADYDISPDVIERYKVSFQTDFNSAVSG